MPTLQGLVKKPTFGHYATLKGIATCPSITLNDLTVNGNANLRQIYFGSVYESKLYLDGASSGFGVSLNQLNYFTPSTWTQVFSVNSGALDILSIGTSGIEILSGNIVFTDLYGVDTFPLVQSLTATKYQRSYQILDIPYNVTFYYDFTIPTGHKTWIMSISGIGTVNGLEWPHVKFISGATVLSTNYYGSTQGTGSVSDHSSGRGIDLWQNSWSTSHIVSGQLMLQYCGTLTGQPNPNQMWSYYGSIHRSGFQVLISGSFLHNDTQVPNKIRIQTNAATDRFSGGDICIISF